LHHLIAYKGQFVLQFWKFEEVFDFLVIVQVKWKGYEKLAFVDQYIATHFEDDTRYNVTVVTIKDE